MSAVKTFSNQVMRATQSQLISWPVFLGLAVMSVVLHLFASPDLSSDQIVIRGLFAFVSVVPMFIVIWAAVLTRIKSGIGKSVLVLASFLLGGAVRGLVLWLLLFQINLVTTESIVPRILTSAANFGITIFVLAYLWNSYTRYETSIRDKAIENEKLQESLELIAYETRQQGQQMVANIASEITNTLREIQESSTQEQISRLEKLVQEQVRPLKSTLEVESAAWEPTAIQMPRIRYSERLLKLDFAHALPRPWLLIPLVLAPFLINSSEFGLSTAITVSIYAGLSAAILYVPLSAQLNKRLQNESKQSQILAINMVFVISGTAGAFGTVFALSGTEDPFELFLPGLLGFFLFAWFVSLGLAYRSALVGTQEQVLAIRKKLRWAISRANLVNLHNRRRIARYLHGPVQSSIQSTMISLRQSSDSGKLNPFDQLLVRLEQSKSPDWRGAEFRARFEEIQLLWRGLCDIEIRKNENVEKLLKTDPTLAAHTVELVRDISSAIIRKLEIERLSLVLEVANLNQVRVSFIWKKSTERADVEMAIKLSSAFEAASIQKVLLEKEGNYEASFLLPGAQYIANVEELLVP